MMLLAPAFATRYNLFQCQHAGITVMKPQNRETIFRIIKKETPYLRSRFGVEHLALFGSFARGEADEGSDIDILVSLERPLGFAFIQLADYLEEKLGRKVDLITATSLELSIADPRRAHIVKDIQESLIDV
jgi:predicted nucleotidyltransferase